MQGDLFSVARVSRRFAPRNSATVALSHSKTRLSYGVVLNLSETGACVVTEAPLPPLGRVHLQISFYQQSEIFEARGRVVWSRRGEQLGPQLGGALLNGIHFEEVTAEQRRVLEDLFASTQFQLTFAPKGRDFETFLNDLREELDRLALKMERDLGRPQ
jgi:hypothetical protein